MEWASRTRLEWPSGRKIPGAAAIGLSDECRREQVAERILAIRKLRHAEFSIQALGEPGFDMLLGLYHLEAHGRPAALEALQLTAGVPTRVARRWFDVLLKEHLIGCDRRKGSHLTAKTLIELTPLGREKLERYLDSVQDLVAYPPA